MNLNIYYKNLFFSRDQGIKYCRHMKTINTSTIYNTSTVYNTSTIKTINTSIMKT